MLVLKENIDANRRRSGGVIDIIVVKGVVEIWVVIW